MFASNSFPTKGDYYGDYTDTVDINESHLDLARQKGAKVTVNANDYDPVSYIKREIGGAHGVLVTAPSRKAFEQAVGMARRGGTIALNGLPPGTFPLSLFDMVLDGTTVRGSIVGTRLDLQEALNFAGEGDRQDGQTGKHQRDIRSDA